MNKPSKNPSRNGNSRSGRPTPHGNSLLRLAKTQETKEFLESPSDEIIDEDTLLEDGGFTKEQLVEPALAYYKIRDNQFEHIANHGYILRIKKSTYLIRTKSLTYAGIRSWSVKKYYSNFPHRRGEFEKKIVYDTIRPLDSLPEGAIPNLQNAYMMYYHEEKSTRSEGAFAKLALPSPGEVKELLGTTFVLDEQI